MAGGVRGDVDTSRPLESLPLTSLLTGECNYTLFFGFQFPQTALLAQTALYLCGFDVVILEQEGEGHSHVSPPHLINSRSELVLQVPVSKFVQRQVLPPRLADGQEEPGVGRVDLLVDVALLLLD